MTPKLVPGVVYVLDEEEYNFSKTIYVYIGRTPSLTFKYYNKFGNGTTTKEAIGVVWMKPASELAQVLYGS